MRRYTMQPARPLKARLPNLMLHASREEQDNSAATRFDIHVTACTRGQGILSGDGKG